MYTYDFISTRTIFLHEIVRLYFARTTININQENQNLICVIN